MEYSKNVTVNELLEEQRGLCAEFALLSVIGVLIVIFTSLFTIAKFMMFDVTYTETLGSLFLAYIKISLMFVAGDFIAKSVKLNKKVVFINKVLNKHSDVHENSRYPIDFSVYMAYNECKNDRELEQMKKTTFREKYNSSSATVPILLLLYAFVMPLIMFLLIEIMKNLLPNFVDVIAFVQFISTHFTALLGAFIAAMLLQLPNLDKNKTQQEDENKKDENKPVEIANREKQEDEMRRQEHREYEAKLAEQLLQKHHEFIRELAEKDRTLRLLTHQEQQKQYALSRKLAEKEREVQLLKEQGQQNRDELTCKLAEKNRQLQSLKIQEQENQYQFTCKLAEKEREVRLLSHQNRQKEYDFIYDLTSERLNKHTK